MFLKSGTANVPLSEIVCFKNAKPEASPKSPLKEGTFKEAGFGF